MTMTPAHTFTTADLCDQHAAELQVGSPMFHSYGAVSCCAGPTETVHVYQNNSLIIECLKEPGNGRILVVRSSSSLPVALVGDRLGTMAHANGWGGLVIYGYVRDTEALSKIPVAIWALGTFPKRADRHGEPDTQGSRGALLQFAGLIVEPGDYLYADSDGILVSKRALV